MNKLKSLLKPYYHVLLRLSKWKRRIGLRCDDFSIISNNCTGGYVYQYYGITYKTPTEGVYFTTDDYLKLITRPQYYFTHKVELIAPSESSIFDPAKPFTFPVGRIDDIEVYFMHYPTPEEALSKWYRRSSRINYAKLFCLLTENDFFRQDQIGEFYGILEKKRLKGVFLTSHKYADTKAKYIPNVPQSGGNVAWRPEIVVSCLDWKSIINSL